MKKLFRTSLAALLILAMTAGVASAYSGKGVTAEVGIQDKSYVIQNGNLAVHTAANTTKILVKKVYRYRGLIGAGNYLYFVKKTKSGKQGIYRFSLSTGKIKLIKTDKMIKLFDSDGRYIYYGSALNYTKDQEGCYNLYSLNLKSKEKKLIEKNVGEVGNYMYDLLLLGHKTHAQNTPLTAYNTQTGEKRHICDAVHYGIYAGKIYYYVLVEEEGSEPVMKYYTCTLDGAEVTEITEEEYYSTID